jgi:hypothetical protein
MNRILTTVALFTATIGATSFADPKPDAAATGVLDFTLTTAPGKFVLHDDAFEVTFP